MVQEGALTALASVADSSQVTVCLMIGSKWMHFAVIMHNGSLFSCIMGLSHCFSAL